MNYMTDDLEQGYDLLNPIMPPNHNISSMLQLSRVGSFTDDTARRLLARLSERFRGPLFSVDEKHRLVATPLGREVWDLGRRVKALIDNGRASAELLTVEIDPALAEVASQVLRGSFMEVFGGLVSMRLCRLNATMVKANIANAQTTFAFGLAQDESENGTEVLDGEFRWAALVPHGHRLSAAVGPIAGSDLRPDDRVCLPCEAWMQPGIRKWLDLVEEPYRIECDWTLVHRLAAAGFGLGLTLDFNGPQSEGLVVRPIAGVQEQKLCLWLPRRAAELPEPALALIDAIRLVVSRLGAEPADTGPVADSNGSDAEMSTAVPVEEMEVQA
jgi:hypothetical protein